MNDGVNRNEDGSIGGIGWSLITPAIYHTGRLTWAQKALWGRINGLIDVKGYCWAPNEWLADDMGETIKKGTLASIISNMVALGFLRRMLIYKKGKDEIIVDSLKGDKRTNIKGYKLVERRLIPTLPVDFFDDISANEDVVEEPSCDTKQDPCIKTQDPCAQMVGKRELDIELDTSIRQKKEKKNGTKEKKENLKADCGYAAPSPTESKDSITNTGEEKYIRKVAEEVRNNGGDFSKYSAVPPWIFQSEELKVNQKILVGAIVSKCISTGNEWCSLCNRDLAKSMGLKQETISSLLSDLASKGFIKEEYIYIDGDGNTIKYKSWDSEQPLVLNGLYLVERRLSVTNRDDVDSIRESSRKSCGKIKYIDPEGNNKNRRNNNDADWAKSVHARDSYICQKCGCNNTTVNAHHIESYDVNEDLRTSINNGSTLCEECHRKFHSIYGNGNNTREQFAKFMEDDSKDKKEQEC